MACRVRQDVFEYGEWSCEESGCEFWTEDMGPFGEAFPLVVPPIDFCRIRLLCFREVQSVIGRVLLCARRRC